MVTICFLFFLHLFWSIIALQWCVSFCFITKWISYTYTYIPISPPSCISLPPSLSHPSRYLLNEWINRWLLYFKLTIGTSLMAQWLRICLPMQGTRVQALVREDPTCRGATKPVHHNYWAHVLQLLKPVCLEPMLHNKRSHCNEKPAHHNEE